MRKVFRTLVLSFILTLSLGTIICFGQYTKLLDFAGTSNGTNPYGSLISDGTFLYGMTQFGGTNNMGTIFKIKPDGTGYVKLLDFSGAANGSIPYGSLFSDGTFLYGMTTDGGTNNAGVIFKIKPDGTGYVKLLDFAGAANGSYPEGTLISDGTFLYGATASGGTNTDGTIFKIKPDGTGYVKLFDFANATSGHAPRSLISDGAFLYGMTLDGGANFMGSVFKIKTDGTGFINLLDFAGAANGNLPYGDLITDGTFLYGMTSTGGTNNLGTIFKIKTDGTGYVKLLDFAGAANGKGPHGSLVYDGTFLYGMTEQGGTSNLGLIFRLMPDGTGYTKLLNFVGATNGSNPYASLIYNGTSLYGMTVAGGTNDLGTVFKYNLAAVPTIASFTPTSGPVGTSVVITGTNFSSTPSNNIVYFGATKANVTAATTTQLNVTVPIGATYRPISVLVNGLTAYSQVPFTVAFPNGGTIDVCSLAPKVDFTTGSTPGGIVIADFDGDGKSDLAIVNLNSNTLSTYLNTATTGDITSGSFAAKVDFATTASPSDLAVGDLDGDGKLDLVSVNTVNTVSVYVNTSSIGTISFAAKVDFTIVGLGGSTDRRVAVADLDGDGKPDVAVPNGFKLVSILQNQSAPGSIAFGTKVDFNISTLNSNPLSIAMADLDGDTKPEITVMQSNTISVLHNISTVGAIDATSFEPYIGFLAGTGAQDLAIGDLDGDSKPDFVTANRIGNSISVIRNTSSPGVIDATSFATKVDFAMGGSGSALPHGVAINDIDGDGKPDIAVARSFSSFLSVFKNATTTGVIDASSFTPQGIYSTGAAQLTTHRIATGDLDGDGTPEVALVNNKISIFRNTTVTLPPTLSSFSPTSGPIGTPVTITGTNFSNVPSRNTVYFNGVYAAITSSTNTQIVVNVPFDATPGPIQVVVGCNSSNTITSAVPFTVNGQCVTSTQRSALVNLYDDTNGSGWDHSMNWLTPDISTWYGVTVTGCFVTGIDLSENNLTGNLPFQLKDLTELTNLYLKENEMTGSVPAELGLLSKLQTLDLSVNHFSDLPDFSTGSLDQANLSFQVYGNNLDFADLEPNVVFSQFNYTPQADIPPGDIISFVSGQSLDIPFNTPGTANSYQWYNNGVATGSPGTVGDFSKANAVAGDAGQYIVEITNSIVTGLILRSVPFTVIADPCTTSTRTAGYLDMAFNPLIDNLTAVTAVGIQSNGQIIVSTGPTSINGTAADGIVRFNPDGSVDNTFVANTTYAGNRQMVIQSDDRIITSYSPYGGYSDITRLNADGSADASFVGTGSDYINGFTRQPDDYLIVSYSTFSGYTLDDYLVRLDPDGNPDNSFTIANLAARVIKVQQDGYILAGGYFPGGITRFTPTGGVDSGFSGYLGGEVTDIVLQPDGKIIVVGTFSDPSVRGIVRLNTDGSIDLTFNALGISSIPSGTYATKILIQSDGKIVISGFFDVVNGSSRPNLVRLNMDGTIDCAFDPGVSSDDAIVDMIFDAAEKIYLVGGFSSIDGTTRNGLARLKTSPGINITQQPSDFITCDGNTATFTTSAVGATNIIYQWQYSSDGVVPFADLSNGGGYSNTTGVTLSVNTTGNFGSGRYRCRINGDLAAEVITDDEGLFITSLPSAPTTTGVSTCSGSSAILNASGGTNGQYSWYSVSTGGTAIAGEVNSSYTTPAISSLTTYYVSINNGTCESLRTSVIADIIPLPIAPTTTGATGCGPVSSLTLTSSGGTNGQYRWYTALTGGTAITGELNSMYSTPLLSSTTTYYVSINDGTCESLRTPVTGTIQICNSPAIVGTVATAFIEGIVTIDLTNLISDPDNNLDLSTLQIIAQPGSGAVATLSGLILSINYNGLPYAVTDAISIRVCDLTGLCTAQQITIEFAGDINIYNAVSPNGDGKNEFLFLQYIEIIPETQDNNVGIFNRWGDEVFSITNYNNKDRVFTGHTNGGSKLPTGTYYYKISFASGAKPHTGYLELKY